MAVSKRLRFEILKRDNHQCRYCGGVAPDVILTIDHIKPIALGGSDTPDNLVAACRDCNAGKSSVPADAPLVDEVAESAVRWAAAMKQVAEMRARELDDHFQMMDWFYSEWNCWTNWRGDFYDADGAEASIPQFITAGLTTQEIKHLIEVAMKSQAKDKWRYFCGCCWKRIRQNQELAAQIVSQEPAEADASKPPQVTVRTRWTQEDVDAFRDIEPPILACELHDEDCTGDLLCELAAVASTRQLKETYEVMDWKARARDEAIADAAEQAEDYVYG